MKKNNNIVLENLSPKMQDMIIRMVRAKMERDIPTNLKIELIKKQNPITGEWDQVTLNSKLDASEDNLAIVIFLVLRADPIFVKIVLKAMKLFSEELPPPSTKEDFSMN